MTGMNATRDPDSVLAAWLDEGPTDLPDATRRAILTALPTTSQARRGLLAPWRFSGMNILARGAAAVVVAVLAIGALALVLGSPGNVGGPSPAPSATPTPSISATAPPLPTLDATFTSSSYGFEIKYPTGWTVTRGTAPWPMGTELFPGNSVSDSIVTPPGGLRVRISGASIALPQGMTIDQFRAWANPLSSPFNNDPCLPVAPIPGPLKLDYEPGAGKSAQQVEAVVSINGCNALAELGGSIYDVEVIAGGRGYEFTLDGHITPADASTWLATIRLQPSSAPAESAAPNPSASK